MLTSRRYLALLLTVFSLGALAAAPTVAGGYSNGQLPSSALAPIRGSNPSLVYLARDGASAAWNTMRICSTASGVDLYTGGDGAYRSLYEQQQRYAEYQNGTGNLAAWPGTSNHGYGHAVDNDLVRMVTWINAHGGEFGWSWGEAPSEWWHVTYYGHFHRPDPGPNVASPILVHGSGGTCQQRAIDEARGRLGLTTGRPFTSNMTDAVKAFQFAHRIPRTGVINARTWDALRGSTRAVKNPAVLRVHSPPFSGQDVAAYQGLINARLKDVRNPHLVKVDGFFGPSTAAALRYLQGYWWRIPKTGMTTATTRAKLKVPLVRHPPAKPGNLSEGVNQPSTKPKHGPAPKVVHRGPMYGADTSEHNGPVNFTAARKRVEFVILRATWTGSSVGQLHVDAQLSNQNCAQARGAGLKLGFYSYDIAGKGGSAERSADFYTSTIWNMPACRFRIGDMLPSHDMEDGNGNIAAAWSRAWRQRVQHNIEYGLHHRYGPVIEYGGSFVRDINPADPGLQSPLWMPGYGNDDGNGLSTYWKGYYTPAAWRARGWWIAIYQYWSQGRWTASGGDVDFNVVENADYWLPKLLIH